MAVIRRTRGAQYPLVAEYVFNYNDGQAYLSALAGASVEYNLKSNVTDFGSGVQPTGLMSGISYVANTGGQTYYFEVVTLPINSQIIGGDVQVEVAYAGPATATLSLGDSSNGTLYASAVNIKTVGRTALTIPAELTSYAANSNVGADAAAGLDVRATLALGAGAATTGRVRVRLLYTIDGRMNESGTQ
jgi:hypothetical protein